MATSGTFTGSRGGSSTGPWLTLDWSRIAVDTTNNKSQLRLTLKLHADYTMNFSASKTGHLEGNSFTYSSGFSGTGSVTLKTLDLWYTHNSDGTLTTNLSGDFAIAISWGGTTVSSLSVSGNATIDTIPRASSFTAFSLANSVLNKDTATTINYTLDKMSTSYTDYLTLKYGNTTIASWSTTSEGALTRTLSATEVNSILSAMSTVTSGTLTLTNQTKSGSTNIGSLSSRTTSVSINSAVAPTASGLSVSIYGSGRDKTLGKYVQLISKVTASFTDAAGYGASISSQNIVVKRQSDSGDSQTITGTSGTTANTVKLSGTYSVVATVTDSRGRTASVSTTITVVAYAAPSISTFSTSRDATTSSTVNATIAASFSMGTDNPTDISVVGVDNANVSTTLYTLNDTTTSPINLSQSYTGQSDASSYTYTLTVTDSFGNVAKATSKVSTTFVELTIAKGAGIGVGKVWEQGVLDVGGDIYTSGNLYFKGNGSYRKVIEVRQGNDSTGDGIAIGMAGTTIIGGGESATNYLANTTQLPNSATETLILTSDNGIVIYTGMQNSSGSSFSSDPVISIDNGAVDAIIHHNANYLLVGSYSSSYGSGSGKIWYDANNGRFNMWTDAGGTAPVTMGTLSCGDIYLNDRTLIFTTPGNFDQIWFNDSTNEYWFNADSTNSKDTTGQGILRAKAFTVASDEELKTNIQTFEEDIDTPNRALDIIAKTPVYTYRYKHDIETEKNGRMSADKRVGLIAQQAPKEILGLGEDSVDIYAMASYLWKGLQEANNRIAYLEAKIKK